MAILLLGGTQEAKQFAQRLIPLCGDQRLIYSVAGLVRIPQLACEVISGGFSGKGGLSKYLHTNDVRLVLDMTHPYAAHMSQQAARCCSELGVAYLAYQRSAWQPEAGDNWQQFDDWPSLFTALHNKQHVFFTAGQPLAEYFTTLEKLANQGQQQLLRTAVSPKSQLPAGMQSLIAIGPFSLDEELALMQQYTIDCLVSKNSGGSASYAKIIAARQLGIPVLFLARPATACQPISDLTEYRKSVMALMNAL